MIEVPPFVALWVFGAFAFAFSACWGSFLNVIVYRMPRQKPVAGGRSYCPRCNTQILWQDNLPIVGWLRLKGISRCCQQSIAARYPIVEALVAVAGLLMFLVIISLHGRTLPAEMTTGHHHDWMTEFPNCKLWVTMLLQGLGLYLSLAMVLINHDRFALPPKLIGLTGVALLCSGIIILAFEIPWLAFIKFDQFPHEKQQSLTIICLGLTMLMVFLSRVSPQRDYALSTLAAVMLFLLGPVGLALVTAGAMLVHWGHLLLLKLAGSKSTAVPASTAMLGLGFVLLLTWKPVFELLLRDLPAIQ